MTRRKTILLVLLVFPLGLLILAFTGILDREDAELLFYAIGVPILVLNMWEWFEPELVGKMFGRR